MVMIFLEIKFYFYFFALTYLNTFMINKLRMYKIKKLKIVLLFFVLSFYNNASQKIGVLLFDNESAEEIKDFEKITFDDAAEAYSSAANNVCPKIIPTISSLKNPKEKNADYYKWIAESYKMLIFKILKNLSTTSQEQEKKELFDSIHFCINSYETAYSKYKGQAKKNQLIPCGCDLCCDCYIFKKEDKTDVNYALAMEMIAKEKDIFNLLIKKGFLPGNSIIEYNFENKWGDVANTKLSYRKYALAKQKEIDYYITNRTDEKLDEVISAWKEVLTDNLLIESFFGEASVSWKAYKSFVERKIKTFEFLKEIRNNNQQNSYESLKEAYKNNFNKDLEAYEKTKLHYYKAFAYEAAALYNEKEIFDGFLEIPTQGNLNL